MSTIIMARCWPLRLPAVAKSVLISLADQANDQAVCWPSVQTISDRTCYGVRAVQNALRWLQDEGLLDVEIGAMRANRYTLRLDRYKPPSDPKSAAPDPAPDAPPHDVHPRTACTPPPQEMHPNRNRTIRVIPPIPPSPGGNTSSADDEGVRTSGRKRGPRPVICLKTWLAQCEAEGVKPIPPGDPIFDYCQTVGITDEMLVLHWLAFRRRYLENGKRQADWRKKLRLSIEGCWYRLWYIGADGKSALSTQGIQAKRIREAAE